MSEITPQSQAAKKADAFLLTMKMQPQPEPRTNFA